MFFLSSYFVCGVGVGVYFVVVLCFVLGLLFFVGRG